MITSAPALVALGERGEEHLHLGAVLLHVADVVEHQTFEAIEAHPGRAELITGYLEAAGHGGEPGGAL